MLNIVQFIGFVGADPEIRPTQSGGSFATFSLATTEREYTRRDGTTVPENTDWHDIRVLNPSLVNVCRQYVKKGSKLYVQGALHSGSYTDKDGVKKFTYRTTASVILLLDGKPQQDTAESSAPAPQPQPAEDTQYQIFPARTGMGYTNSPDDLPF